MDKPTHAVMQTVDFMLCKLKAQREGANDCSGSMVDYLTKRIKPSGLKLDEVKTELVCYDQKAMQKYFSKYPHGEDIIEEMLDCLARAKSHY